MKRIYIIMLSLFMAGCASTSDPFFNINNSCNRFYNENKRWPSSETELRENEQKFTDHKTDWSSISDFKIMKISDDQAYITYSTMGFLGKNTVSGSIYRPIVKVTIKYNNPGNQADSSD